uniref:Uncharacterized protein n=1 Tax=Corethron hystrix TaxID=216773 RepID=A0A7S1FZ08_9STRA|mmetsp:Transcript_41659/g.97527  ORF Transcript_41659/g.97527 Transcript_41659/m.97527 type:complete len:111 (+) Transcript_41659:219-551(+)
MNLSTVPEDEPYDVSADNSVRESHLARGVASINLSGFDCYHDIDAVRGLAGLTGHVPIRTNKSKSVPRRGAHQQPNTANRNILKIQSPALIDQADKNDCKVYRRKMLITM